MLTLLKRWLIWVVAPFVMILLILAGLFVIMETEGVGWMIVAVIGLVLIFLTMQVFDEKPWEKE